MKVEAREQLVQGALALGVTLTEAHVGLFNQFASRTQEVEQKNKPHRDYV